MGIQKEFYDSLRREYELEGENSFLYRYFLNRPQHRRGGKEDPDVRRAIRTFLYDVQHGRKKDQSLAMLDAYCAQRGISFLLSGGGEIEKQENLEELEAFFRTLKAGKNTSILIPLKIDPGTGAGLYLMGTYYLERADLHLDGACCYACLWMEDLELWSAEADGHYLWSIGTREKKRLEEQCGFPNLAEAICWFQHLIAMDQEAYQAYAINNGPAPPNCPPSLRRYFGSSQLQTDFNTLMIQGRESFLRDGTKDES